MYDVLTMYNVHKMKNVDGLSISTLKNNVTLLKRVLKSWKVCTYFVECRLSIKHIHIKE